MTLGVLSRIERKKGRREGEWGGLKGILVALWELTNSKRDLRGEESLERLSKSKDKEMTKIRENRRGVEGSFSDRRRGRPEKKARKEKKGQKTLFT